MLERLLEKMDLSDPAVVKILIESQPAKWEGGFEGLHTLVHKGVRSSMCMDRSLAVMERLIKLPSSLLVGNESRLLFVLLANLPRYLHHFEDDSNGLACIESAETLAFAAESQGRDNLARSLHGFAKMRYRNDKDFLSQTVSAIRTAFFPIMEYQSLVFLLGLINNQTPWFKIKTMQLLCVVIPDIDMRKPEIACHGPDFISPLLRLLQTEYCQQALDVLDNVMSMSGTPLDNKHLRMSMAGSHSSRATRKEYDSTKSLYGIPEQSGWSIPMPAVHSAQTRSNVHAVFATIAWANNGAEEATTPEIEFHKDEYQYDYFAERTATMTSEDTRKDGNMGELAMKLDDLDDFFDDQTDAASSSRKQGRYSNGLVEHRENLYDQQTVPILHRSLKRNASVTSFQTGFAEMRYPASREPLVMTPGAFSQPNSATTRPGLHSRSITSPATSIKPSPAMLQNDLLSGDESGDEPFSDDDLSIGRAHTADEPFHSLTVKPTGIRAGFRQGIRRLTSGGGGGERREARDALNRYGSTAQKSPRVPKVPTAWLRDPVSAEP